MPSLESRNPATGQVLGSVTVTPARRVAALADEVDRVARGWALVPLAERAALLGRAAAVIARRRWDLSERITAETGKTVMESSAIEVTGMLLICDWLAGWATRYLSPERVPHTKAPVWHKRHRILYRPLGTVAVIGPWNYPFSLAGSEVAFALVAGNGVVLKPSELTPLAGEMIAEVFAEAGLPDGVLRVAQGGGDVGAALCRAPAVRKVFFTGSTGTGRKIMQAAAKHGKPVVLEMGGKDPAIVLADADLDRAVAGVGWGAFANAGQTCASVERVYVERPVYEEFVSRVVQHAKRLEPGDPTDPDTQVGAVTELQHARVVEHLEQAVAAGARLECGGPVDVPGLGGRFVAPAVLTGVDHSMKVMTEETFGPVLPVMPFDRDAQALALANDSPYGLGASVWTGDPTRARALASGLEAGMVWVNDHAYSHPVAQTPWGGVKASGVGVVHSKHGLYEMVDKVLLSEDRGLLPGGWWWHPYDRVKRDGFAALVDALFARGDRVRGLPARWPALRDYLRQVFEGP